MTDAVTTPDTGAAAPAAPVAAPAAPLTAVDSLTAAAPAAAPEAPATLPDGAVQMPGKEASAEDWSAFYAKLGRPEAPEGYELPLPDGDDGAFAKQVAPMLHKAGITGEQAKALASEWNTFQAAQAAEFQAAEQARITAMDTQNKAEATELRNEWGTNHDANMEFAKRAVTQFLPAEHAGDIIAAIEARVGYRATIEMLHGIGKGMAEHDAAGLGEPGAQPTKSLAQRMYPGMN